MNWIVIGMFLFGGWLLLGLIGVAYFLNNNWRKMKRAWNESKGLKIKEEEG